MRKVLFHASVIAAASLLASAPAVAGKGKGPTTGGGTTTTGSTTSTGLPGCGQSDFVAPGPVVLACVGFRDGNLLNDKPANLTTDQQILKSLGYDGWDGKITDVAASVSNLNGSKTLDFGVTLTGKSIFGIHYGGGQGGPGSQSTAFYVLDAAQGINQLHLKYNASSNAVLFVTGLPFHVGAVPEPATWATMIMGFGLVGAQMRRRRGLSLAA